MTSHLLSSVTRTNRRNTSLFIGLITLINSVSAFDLSHSTWTTILQTHTKKANVDYKALQQNSVSLDAYLASIAEVEQKDFKEWNVEDQLACLINLYNAATIRLIIDEYPIKSIKDIGFLPHAAWRRKFVTLWGDKVSLNHIEHNLIRPLAKSHPEIHFALVCAAKGCPALRKEAFVGEQLTSQLHDQGVTFLSNSSKNRVDKKTKTLHLSPIFDWYQADFETKGSSVKNYLIDTFPDLFPSAAKDFTISFTEYDWSLNGH